MLFSTSIPDKLSEQPNVKAFMGVLDGVQEYKRGIISESLRVNNPALLLDKKWLLRYLEDFGFSDIPYDLPIQVMQQLALNVETVCATRGSKIGLELFCSIISLGEVAINDDNFYTPANIILLDTISQGVIVGDDYALESTLYLTDDNSLINPKVNLQVNIGSLFFTDENSKEALVIQNYIKKSVPKQVGFSNVDIDYHFVDSDSYYFHKLLNDYFV